MYKVYSRNEELIILPKDTLPNGQGWVYEVDTTDPNYITNHYASIEKWIEDRFIQIEKEQLRPIREIILAQSAGESSEFARTKIIQLETEAKNLRNKLGTIKGKRNGG